MDLSAATLWWVAAGVAGRRRAGHRHLLSADDGARPGRRARSPRTSASARTGAARRRRARRRRRDRALALAARARAARRAGRRSNRDVNLDIGERVHVDRLGRRRHGARALPRRDLDGAPRSRAPPQRRASTCVAAVEGNWLVLARRAVH